MTTATSPCKCPVCGHTAKLECMVVRRPSQPPTERVQLRCLRPGRPLGKFPRRGQVCPVQLVSETTLDPQA